MKKCEFGHYYSDHLDACPYCNAQQGTGSVTSGFEDQGTTSGFLSEEQTIPFGGGVPGGGAPGGADAGELPTMQSPGVGGAPGLGGTQQTTPFTEKFSISNNDSMDKTIIIDQGTEEKDKEPVVRPTRKLVGWLVSYTLDEMGYDYRLYEGKNVIGSKPGNEVSIIQDNSVSGIHATILFRNNKFLLRDEFSTNGTFLNDKIVEEDTPVLKDGDIIKVGNTVFKFKVAVF